MLTESQASKLIDDQNAARGVKRPLDDELGDAVLTEPTREVPRPFLWP